MKAMSDTIIQISLTDLRAVVREEVERVVSVITDRPITRREAAQIRGCSERSIDLMIRRGELRRLPGVGHPRVSYNEVVKGVQTTKY
jgi:hypothetical protein